MKRHKIKMKWISAVMRNNRSFKHVNVSDYGHEVFTMSHSVGCSFATPISYALASLPFSKYRSVVHLAMLYLLHSLYIVWWYDTELAKTWKNTFIACFKDIILKYFPRDWRKPCRIFRPRFDPRAYISTFDFKLLFFIGIPSWTSWKGTICMWIGWGMWR
jgi:hypothetical protein